MFRPLHCHYYVSDFAKPESISACYARVASLRITETLVEFDGTLKADVPPARGILPLIDMDVHSTS